MLHSALAHLRTQWAGMLALFLVLGGGTALAADALDGPLAGQNQVGSLDVIDGQIRSPDIGDGRVLTADLAGTAVTGQKVKDGSLTGVDIDESTLQQADPPHAVAAWQQFVNCTTDSTRVGQFCGDAADLGHWTNYGNGFQDARYFKDLSGNVHIEGSVAVTGGSTKRVIFVLPQGYRPAATRLFTVYDELASGQVSYVKVFSNGYVALQAPTEQTQSSFVQLDGIVFRP